MVRMVISTRHPCVRKLLFNPHDKLNALSSPLMTELDAAHHEAAADPDVSVVVPRALLALPSMAAGQDPRAARIGPGGLGGGEWISGTPCRRTARRP
ncbi:hypothetical protein ROA7023_04008 [Roseisalinus antarcticus]|uniref:Uncharacterized protein n=1 Tax=Roseisalinus antarcticus TaxID=254357 RepID=A0A1Y5U0L1_9RHOB|nr:hypothetical protein ROA7023_04008 [Roseisalinus antarcticus]